MKDLISALEGKVQKHEDKLKAHLSSEEVLQTEHEHLVSTSNDTDKIENVERKLLSTIKSIEYHKGSKKTYQKVIDMIGN